MGASGWGRDAAWAQVASLRFARGPAHGPPFNLFISTVCIHAIINGPGIVLETLCSITLQAVLHWQKNTLNFLFVARQNKTKHFNTVEKTSMLKNLQALHEIIIKIRAFWFLNKIHHFLAAKRKAMRNYYESSKEKEARGTKVATFEYRERLYLTCA